MRFQGGCHFVVALTLLAGASFAPMAHSDPVVLGYELVSSTRYDRIRWDFVYRVRYQNAVPAYSSGTLTVSSSAPATTIPEGTVVLGAVAANTTGVSTDTFTLRQDRTILFDPTRLQWQWNGTPEAPPPPPTVGVFLTGEPGALATLAIVDVGPLAEGVSAQEISTDETGGKVARTRLSARIAAGATVGQINAYLASEGLRVVTSNLSSSSVVLSVPDPGSLSGIVAIRDRARVSGLFDFVWLAGIVETGDLPLNVGVSEAELTLPNQLAVRAPAAWNARNTANANPGATRVTLIVADYFGCGAPSPQVFGVRVLDESDFRDRREGGVCRPLPNANGQDRTKHGYHVLGIATGRYLDGLDGMSGINPASLLRLRAVDLAPAIGLAYQIDGNVYSRIKHVVRQQLTDSLQRVVVNTSLICGGTCPVDVRAQADNFAQEMSARWGEQLLWTAAAGNEGVFDSAAGVWRRPSALLNGQFARIAGHLGDNAAGGGLIVESRAALNFKPPLPTACLSSFSNIGGNISAIGQDVWSFTRADGQLEKMDGTSMATPQVAGLAAWMWVVAPTRPANEIQNLIVLRAWDPADLGSSCPDASRAAPPMDAYAALLGLDVLGPTRPVRQSMLNVGGGASNFDFPDLAAYVRAFRTPSSPSSPDYSRFDLNGDGFTGGSGKAKLDLNYNGIIEQSVPVPNNANNETLNEREVTDVQALCYYILSPLGFAASDTFKEGLALEYPNEPACNALLPESQLPQPIVSNLYCGQVAGNLGTRAELNRGAQPASGSNPTAGSLNIAVAPPRVEFVAPFWTYKFGGEVKMDWSVTTPGTGNVFLRSATDLAVKTTASVSNSNVDFIRYVSSRVGAAEAIVRCEADLEVPVRREVHIRASGSGTFNRGSSTGSLAVQSEAITILNELGTGVVLSFTAKDIPTGGVTPSTLGAVGARISEYTIAPSASASGASTNFRLLNPGKYRILYGGSVNAIAGGEVLEAASSGSYQGRFELLLLPITPTKLPVD